MLLIITVILIIIAIYIVFAYNRLVRHRNLVAEAWSSIDVQLKRRYNLIPNLVNTVKSYAGFEQDVLEKTTKLRSMAENADNMKDQINAEVELSAQVKSLLAVVENYPDLKANKTYEKLMETLIEIENTIQYARRYFNGSVRDYNISVESFPSMIIANIFNFEHKEYFEIDLITQRHAPDLKEEMK